MKGCEEHDWSFLLWLLYFFLFDRVGQRVASCSRRFRVSTSAC